MTTAKNPVRGHLRRPALLLAVLVMMSLLVASPGPAQAASGEYIVVLKPGVSALDDAKSLGALPTHVYRSALNGYSAHLSGAQLAKALADPAVSYVEPDAPMQTAAAVQPPQSVPFPIRRVGGLLSPTAKIDGIDGIDERVNIDVAVLDTGIDLSHPDLNVVGGYNCSNGQSYADADGHGTQVAGTLGAIDNAIGVVGIAPGVRLWSVRVLNNQGKGSTSSILCGIDWVTAHASVIEVANMSLGGQGRDDSNCGLTRHDAFHQAICASVAAGVTYVVAAGNGAADAARTIPAAYDEVITVSALADSDAQAGGLGGNTCVGDPDDTLARFSNFGPDIDIAASGECVGSTTLGGTYGGGSGTSFAAPAVSGAAALYISTHPYATPAQVRAALLAAAEPGPITGDPDTYPEGILNVSGL